MNGATVTLHDASHLRRVGLKGPGAEAWLQGHGIALPQRANSWCAMQADEQDIVVRLGTTEFLLEQASVDTSLRALAGELATPVAGVYPVLREDRAVVLGGEGADTSTRGNVQCEFLRSA